MKSYVRDPALYRAHFAGGGAMPVFRGRRTQRGRGRVKKLLKKYAVPLIKAGARAAAPHAGKIAKKLTKSVAKHAFANNPAMQQVVGHVVDHVADGLAGRGRAYKKRTRRAVVRPKKRPRRQEPTDDIFSKNGAYTR